MLMLWARDHTWLQAKATKVFKRGASETVVDKDRVKQWQNRPLPQWDGPSKHEVKSQKKN